jgi:hypothetical protein
MEGNWPTGHAFSPLTGVVGELRAGSHRRWCSLTSWTPSAASAAQVSGIRDWSLLNGHRLCG